MASAARKAAEEALETVRRGTKDHYGAAAMLFRALSALLSEQDGAGAKQDDCLCRCPETPGTHTATRCWDPAPSPASDPEAEWTVVQGDIYNRLNPGSPMRSNSSGTWVVGPFHRSYGAAQRDLPSPARDEVREAAEALLRYHDACGMESSYGEALRAALAARGERGE